MPKQHPPREGAPRLPWGPTGVAQAQSRHMVSCHPPVAAWQFLITSPLSPPPSPVGPDPGTYTVGTEAKRRAGREQTSQLLGIHLLPSPVATGQSSIRLKGY